MPDQEIDNQGSSIETQTIYNKNIDEEKFFEGVGTVMERLIKANSEYPLHKSIGSDQKKDDSDELKFSKGKDFVLNDHLTDLPEDTSSSYSCPKETIPEEAFRDAAKNRIVLMACPIESLLHTAIYSFIEKFEEKGTNFVGKKYLEVKTIDLEYSVPPSVQWFLEESGGKSQVYILDVNFTGLTSLFLDSLSQVMRDHARNFLQKKNNLLLVKIDSRQLDDEILENFSQYIWEVPFLIPFLKRKGYEHLTEKIFAQRKLNKWSQKESKFYHEINKAIIDGTLRSECEIRDKMIENPIFEKKKEKDEEQLIWHLLEKQKKPLRRYLIFIVAFFEGINDDDLDVLLKALIENDKKLLKKYNEGLKSLLKDSCIQRTSNGDYDFIDLVLEFTNPDFREQAIKYFFLEDFNFVRTQCNSFLRKGFLLQKRPSFNSYRNLIILIGKVSKASSGYGLKLLKHLIAAIVSVEPSIDLSIPDFRIDDLFNENLYESELEYKALIESVNPILTLNILLKRSSGYGVLAEVIREMSNHSRLEQDLRQFFHFLISKKQHVAAFEVIRILRYSTKLDKIGWLRQLIDGGEANIKIKAFEYLITLAPHNPIHLADYLQNIYEWLPVRTNPETYSPANKYALRFIFEFCNYSYLKLKLSDEEFGCYPSAYVLFTLMTDAEDGQSWLTKIMGWLTHEGVEYAWKEDAEEITLTKRRYYFSIANLLENWHAILHGFSRDPVSIENMELFNKILDSFIPIAMSDRVTYQSLVENWTRKNKYYEQQVRKINRQTKENTTPQDLKVAEKNRMEFAARRYLLIEKFLPKVKQKISMHPAQF